MGEQESRSPENGAAAGTGFGDRILPVRHNSKVSEVYEENAEESIFSAEDHQSVIQAIEVALAYDETRFSNNLVPIFESRLSLTKRVSLTFAALRSLPPDERETVVEAASFDTSRPPPLLDENVMAEARLRAAAKTTRERKASLTANWEILSETDRARFLARVVGRVGLLRFIRSADPDALDELGIAVGNAMTPGRWAKMVRYIQNGGRDAA